ncbi:MAG TPA: MazG-like family protein [bacterium]|nr:MazG-like family protein [bacterium]HPJ71743.1 MazG-like family protein [bacterium]HPQ66560.1 MazG-like family protein [bacterium]
MKISQAQQAIKDLLGEMEHPRLGSYIALSEEVGEVADEIMNLEIYGRKHDTADLASEMGDVMVALCELANVYGIDLESVFTAKVEELKPRVSEWERTLAETLRLNRERLD